MAAPSTPAPAPAAPRRRRPLRLRRAGVLLLGAALALWLAGRGLGLLGRGATDPQQAPEGEPSPQVVGVQPAPAAPAGESQEVAAVTPPTAGTGQGVEHGTAGAAPGPSTGAPAGGVAAPPVAEVEAPGGDEAAPAEAAPPQPSVDADRFHSLCSIIELRLQQGELVGAAGALARLRSQPLDVGQRAAAEELQRQLVDAVQAVGSALHGSLQRGEVLAARPLAERWFAAMEGAVQGGAAELPPPLHDAFVGGLDWRRPLQANDAAPPQPAPLDRRRRVRLDWRGELVVGSVAQARADQVTVRVETTRGQSYPTVPAVACEPLDADADEAVEMALVAVAAGEPLLARLWWARALVLGVDASAPRPARLRELLR